MKKIALAVVVVAFASYCYYLAVCPYGINRYLEDTNMLCFNDGIKINDSQYNNDPYKKDLNTISCDRPLRFLSVPRPLVALASFPGSGSSWTRLLLETVTGVFTGSVYMEKIFVGSKRCPARGKVHIVKTHMSDFNVLSHPDCANMDVKHLNFTSAIYILRNPYNALLAEFNRIHSRRTKINRTISAKVGIATRELFDTAQWSTFAEKSASVWRHMTISWMNKDVPVFLLVYERLLGNVQREIMNLSKFLRYQMHIKYIACLSSNITKIYKRNKPTWLTKEKLYKIGLRRRINALIMDVIVKVGPKLNVSSALYSYLLPAR